MLVRLVAADFPAFAEFTYGKRVNKAFKGTEKATDLLQTPLAKSHWIYRVANRLGFVSVSQFKAVADLDSKSANAKSNKSTRSTITRYD
jgi:hypothetical protein